MRGGASVFKDSPVARRTSADWTKSGALPKLLLKKLLDASKTFGSICETSASTALRLGLLADKRDTSFEPNI